MAATDETLYREARAGSSAAFGTLYARYESRIFGFLLRRVKPVRRIFVDSTTWCSGGGDYLWVSCEELSLMPPTRSAGLSRMVKLMEPAIMSFHQEEEIMQRINSLTKALGNF